MLVLNRGRRKGLGMGILVTDPVPPKDGKTAKGIGVTVTFGVVRERTAPNDILWL